MTTVSHDSSAIDKNITRVLNTLRANRGLSTGELIAKSGIAESTYFRRRKLGGWTAGELAALAEALDVPWSVFEQDAAAMVPGRKASITATTDHKPSRSRRAQRDAAFPLAEAV